MQTRLYWSEEIADDGTETHEFNWARHFAKVNRKNMRMVDSDGTPMMYTVGIKQRSRHTVAGSTGNVPISTTIKTASNGYVTVRAVKAWYKAWRAYLRRNRIKMSDLGPYGKDFRFDLTTSDTLDNALSAGDWSNTKVAVEAPQDSDNTDDIAAHDMIDDYSFTLTGASVAESADHGEQKYTTVGIIDSWLDARRNPAGPAADGSDEATINHEANPLFNLVSGSLASEEVLEIVEDIQKDDPPYSHTEHSDLFFNGMLASSVHSSDYCVVQCPAGLMQAVVSNPLDDNNAAVVEWEVELLDVSPMRA